MTSIAGHVAELHEALLVPPQTNEVGRAAALLAGLFDLVAATGVTRVRLLEVGASAGLNLLVDRIRFTGPGWSWGPADSPLLLADAIEGDVAPVPFSVVDRAGCDLSPVNARTAAGQRLLTSFVWPFDLHRQARLAAALELGSGHPVTVDRAAAADWLPDRLRRTADPDVLTVVWHSLTQLSWPAAEVAAVEMLLADHGRRFRLARVTMEYDANAPDGSDSDRAPRPAVRTELWRPGVASPRRRLLGSAHDHRIPVRLAPRSPQSS